MSIIGVKCRDCHVFIPYDTGYQLETCDCEDDFIGVDGGGDGPGHYVRFIGNDPDKFIHDVEK